MLEPSALNQPDIFWPELWPGLRDGCDIQPGQLLVDASWHIIAERSGAYAAPGVGRVQMT